MEEKKVKQRWKEYFEKLLNQENPGEKRKMRTEKIERGTLVISPWKKSEMC